MLDLIKYLRKNSDLIFIQYQLNYLQGDPANIDHCLALVREGVAIEAEMRAIIQP